MQLRTPASESAIADTVRISGASFPDDLLAFMRHSNGAIADLPAFGFMRLNPIEEWAADTVANEAPRNVWMIGSDGSGGAFCWDQRRKARQFVHASTDGFKVWKKMGSSFEAFLEALIEWGKQQQAAAGGNTDAAAPAPPPSSAPASAPLLPPIPLRQVEPEPLEGSAAAAAQQRAEVLGASDPAPPWVTSGGEPPAYLQAGPGIVVKFKAGEMVPWGGIALSTDARVAATAVGDPAAPMSGDLLVHVWDLGTKKSVKQVALKEKLLWMGFTLDSRRLLAITVRASGDNASQTLLSDLLTGQELLDVPEVTTRAAYTHPTPQYPGGLLASIVHHGPSARAYACVRDVSSGELIFSVACDRGGVALMPDGKRLIVGGNSASAASLFDLKSKKRLAWCQFPLDENEPCSISPDGHSIATTTTGVHPPRGMIAELSSGTVLRDFPSLTARKPQAIALLDGNRAAVHTHAGTLHVMSIQSGEELAVYECTRKANSVYLAPAGEYLLAGADTSKSVTLYKL
jgi:WD40 repeat protein